MNTKYGISWIGNIEWEDENRNDHTRESALSSMREAGYVIDNGDDDCLVWETERESIDDDGANAIGRLVTRAFC